MPRKLIPSRRFALLAVSGLAVALGVWWATHGPREPVYKGKRLSWWFTEELAGSGTGTRRLTAAELKSLGPDAVTWLSYKAAQTSILDREGATWSSNRLRDRVYWRIRDFYTVHWPSTFRQVRFESIVALEELGPDAAGAIPALLEAVRHADNDSRLVAASALIKMGDASWPAVLDAILHGDFRTQQTLLRQVSFRPADWSAVAEAIRRGEVDSQEVLLGGIDLRLAASPSPVMRPRQFAEMVDLLVSRAVHPSRDLRELARTKLDDCLESWSRHPEKAERIRLVAERLADRGELERVQILYALAVLDPEDPRWPAQLYELAASPNKELAEAAERALIHAGK